MTGWLRLTEPTGNRVWVNRELMSLVYRETVKGEEVTTVVVGLTRIYVTEMPDEILFAGSAA